MKVVIATKNAGKIEGAKRAFLKFFSEVEIEGVDVSSDISEQPVNKEIYFGACNRVKNLKSYCEENKMNADFYIAIESGINNLFGEWMNTNIAIIENNKGIKSCGSSASFPIPQGLVKDIINTDLNQVADNLFSKDELRRASGGTISLLTKNKVSRIDLTEQAFTMALTPYINSMWR